MRSTSSEPKPTHCRARSELTVSTWNVDERICGGRAHDHVRFLSCQRLEHERLSLHARAGAHELVAFLVASQANREPPRLEARQGIREPLQGSKCGLDEELAADESGHRVSGQAEDERVPPHTERDRLARLDRHPPEDLLDTELTLDRPDEIVLADRDAARGDENVGREPSLERFPQWRLVVGDRRLDQHLGPCGGQRGTEHEAVRLVDLTWTELFAGIDELAARGEHGDARATRAPQLGDTGGRGRRQTRGSEPDAGASNHLPDRDVAAPRTDVRSRLGSPRDLDFVFTTDNMLDRDDGICVLRHDRSRGDGHSGAGVELPVERLPRGRVPADPQPSGQIGRAHRKSVHRRTRERRQVDFRLHVLRADAAGGLDNRNSLYRQPTDAAQHPLMRLLECE